MLDAFVLDAFASHPLNVVPQLFVFVEWWVTFLHRPTDVHHCRTIAVQVRRLEVRNNLPCAPARAIQSTFFPVTVLAKVLPPPVVDVDAVLVSPKLAVDVNKVIPTVGA